MIKNRVLYCTYDGLLDPLGGSQILPYVYSFSTFIESIDILSFEKKERYKLFNQKIYNKTKLHNIYWYKRSFTKKFGLIGKLYDLINMFFTILFLILTRKYKIIHCRSYIPMFCAVIIKKFIRIKIIFDMRGLWFDEKFDRIYINKKSIFFIKIFKFLKILERYMIKNSDKNIVLTKKVKKILEKDFTNEKVSFYTIPSCADFNFFVPLSAEKIVKTKFELNIEPNSKILSYIGSLGTWYLFEEKLLFFEKLLIKDKNFYFLIITNDWNSSFKNFIDKKFYNIKNKIIIKSLQRNEIPSYLGCSDIMCSFIKPLYSKIASSPTKFAESLAMGIPVLSTKNIGDVDEQTKYLNAGAVLDLNNSKEIDDIINNIEKIISLGGNALRNRAKKIFSLDIAINNYKKIYFSLVN